MPAKLWMREEMKFFKLFTANYLLRFYYCSGVKICNVHSTQKCSRYHKKNEGTNLECNLVKLKGWTTPVLLCLKVCGKRDLKVIGGRNVWYFPCCNKPLGVLGWITCWIGPKPASRLWAPVQESQSEPKAPEHEAYPSKGDLSSLCLFCLSLAFPSTTVPYDISPFFWHRSLWLLVK